jgi:uncharacterized membrane protein YkvI
MGLNGSSVFQRIWMPGFMLQSVVIGGGYATGRELVEFFLSAGPLRGLLGMLVATVLFSIASVLCFELARLARTYNYRSFFGELLGPAWFLYEIAYFVLGILVLAVLAAASGEIFSAQWHLDRNIGVVLLMLPIGLLAFYGTPLIEKVLSFWSFVLYATYVVLVASYLFSFGDALGEDFTAGPADGGWFVKSVSYFGYNLAIIPIVLFCVRHLSSRGDAVRAGLLAGPLVMIPGMLFFIAMAVSYPEILDVAVPADFMMKRLNQGWLQTVFYIVVFGTFVETGVAFVHALNERIALRYEAGQRTMPRWLRPAIAIGALCIAVVLAVRFGIIDLIARGYGTLTWVFILVFALPLCTIGVWKIRRLARQEKSEPAA